MADDVEKRLHYFTGQFLEEKDFTDEQKYFLDRLDRHHRFLHTPGVADGLEVQGEINSPQVTVDKGTAIDGNGKQIVLASTRSVDLNTPELRPKLTDSSNILLIVISYDQQPDPKVAPSDERFPRWLEQPQVQAILEKENPSEVQFIRLARLKVSQDGKLLESPEDIRKKAGQQTISDNSIIAAKLAPAVREKLVTKGDQHDHTTGNGGNPIKHTSLDLTGAGTNPHKTTAVDVNALSLTGGTVKGLVNITTIGGKGKLDVRTENEGVFDNPNSRISDTGSVFILNTKPKSYGLVVKITDTDLAMPNTMPISPAAVVAIAGFDDAHAIYATAKTGNGKPALYVEGTARIGSKDLSSDKINPALLIDGFARATGGFNPSHIVDTFINASGKRLRTGDVVKLKGTPVTRFQGYQNKIPVAEVTLADKENDTLVIGIVDREAFPEPETTDTRVEPEDPSFIEDGGELYLVTIGVFAHCKVDATEAQIEVGDLLTTSNNPGYAKKATEPKLGSIIGKALAPLKEGTGEIAVFVNIQ